MTECKSWLGLMLVCGCGVAMSAQAAPHWVGSWACAPTGELPTAKEVAQGGPRDASVTVRNIVHLSLGGKVLRLRLSNEFGTAPLEVKDVHLALGAGKDAIDVETDHPVKFGGATDLTIAAGGFALSDPIPMQAPAFASLAVSMFVPQQKDVSLTYHGRALSTNFFAPGDQAGASHLKDARKIATWVFLTGVDVDAPAKAAAIVAYGDSITDGLRSTLDGNKRWPDDLARRLQANPATAELSVLNLGISGNRILYDQGGPSLLARLDRDVFGQSGVKYLILFAGINDLHHAVNRPDPAQKESVEDIVAGMKQIVARAHAHGIKVFGATITPDGGSQFHNPPGEAMRVAINSWIRTGGAFDGWFDFDKAVRSASDPEKLAEQYDSPDHTHLLDAGYQAVADSIDLSVFH